LKPSSIPVILFTVDVRKQNAPSALFYHAQHSGFDTIHLCMTDTNTDRESRLYVSLWSRVARQKNILGMRIYHQPESCCDWSIY